MASLARNIFKSTTTIARASLRNNPISALPSVASVSYSPGSSSAAVPNSSVHTPCSICEAPVPCDLCKSFGRDSIVAIFDTSSTSQPEVTFFQELSTVSDAAVPDTPTCAICGEMEDGCDSCISTVGFNVTSRIHALPGFEHLITKVDGPTMTR
ncbi:hypothetical protein TrCOL_g3593 [Triparma columacea]|uniref:Uncharacterized protein n=1 Tax=Triparma columacea TaxID=722753 RepID=A0A9W7L324_9STRA|nr:hypothetical protein TrCOL_g3593 [Triparma columacea]